MKKLTIVLTALAFLSLALFHSCDEETANPPSLEVTPTADQQAYPGDTVEYTIKAAGDQALSVLDVKYTVNDGSANNLIQQTLDDDSVQVNASITLAENLQAGDTVVVTVMVSDIENLTAQAMRVIVIQEKEVQVMSNEGVTLHAQANGPTTADTNLTFYSVNLDSAFTYNQMPDNESDIDVVFVHHSLYYKSSAAAEETSFQSPNLQNLVDMWNAINFGTEGMPDPYTIDNKNTTYFKEITDEVDWANLDAETLETTIGEIGTVNKVTQLTEGKIIAFETQAGALGLIKITGLNVDNTDYEATTVSFDVKYINE